MEDNDTPPEGLGCIYLITNKINGRMYVGKTIRNTPSYRFYQHCKRSQYSPTTPLYIDMNKFGVQNFSVEVLCYDYKENLDDDEIFWAETLQTYVWDKPTHGPRGYNATKCGVFTPGAIPSAETRYKIGCTWRGKTFSEEHKRKLCIARKKRIQTPEYNMKARNNRIASVLENGAKGVKLKKKDVLTIVKKVNEGVSQTELAATYNVQISVISRIMSGERWGDVNGILKKEPKKRTHAKLGIETANKIREIYAKGAISLTDLSKAYDVNKSTIGNIIKCKLYPQK